MPRAADADGEDELRPRSRRKRRGVQRNALTDDRPNSGYSSFEARKTPGFLLLRCCTFLPNLTCCTGIGPIPQGTDPSIVSPSLAVWSVGGVITNTVQDRSRCTPPTEGARLEGRFGASLLDLEREP